MPKEIKMLHFFIASRLTTYPPSEFLPNLNKFDFLMGFNKLNFLSTSIFRLSMYISKFSRLTLKYKIVFINPK